MKPYLLGAAVAADVAATILLIIGFLQKGLAAFNSLSFDAALACLWLIAGVMLVLALRR